MDNYQKSEHSPIVAVAIPKYCFNLAKKFPTRCPQRYFSWPNSQGSFVWISVESRLPSGASPSDPAALLFSVGNVCHQGPRSDPKWFPATRLHPCRSWAWPVLIWKPVGLWGHHRLHGFWSLDLRGRNRYILGAITFFAKALCWATGTSKICCQTPRLSTHMTSVNHAKVAKAFGQIAPRNAFPITVEHCLDKEAITLSSHADGSRPVGDNCPLRCPWSSRRA